jgi:hypothetical protein
MSEIKARLKSEVKHQRLEGEKFVSDVDSQLTQLAHRKSRTEPCQNCVRLSVALFFFTSPAHVESSAMNIDLRCLEGSIKTTFTTITR